MLLNYLNQTFGQWVKNDGIGVSYGDTNMWGHIRQIKQPVSLLPEQEFIHELTHMDRGSNQNLPARIRLFYA
jgi:hypothetical protein